MAQGELAKRAGSGSQLARGWLKCNRECTWSSVCPDADLLVTSSWEGCQCRVGAGEKTFRVEQSNEEWLGASSRLLAENPARGAILC